MQSPSSFARLDIDLLDGVLHARMRSGEHRPIRNGGKPVRQFNFGWSATYVVDLGLDVFLLELWFHDGHRATWFLDAELNRLCDQVGQLADQLRAGILDALFPYLHTIYHDLLSSPAPDAPPGADIVALICEPTMRNIVDRVMPRIAPNLRVRRPGSALSDQEGFDPQALQGGLQQALDHALAGNPLNWQSPIDGTIRQSRDSLAVSEHRIGYRFHDGGTVFYVGATHHVFLTSDIFIPASQCVLVDVPDDLTGRGAPTGAASDYLTHAALHATALCRYFADDSRIPAVIVRGFPGMHIGHHVWNELTALDRLQRTVPAEKLPLVIVPDADNGSEPFAPIEQILPAFAGRIDRTHAYRKEPVGALTYRRSLFLVRSMDECVSTHLSHRIREASLAQPLAQRAKQAAQEYRDDGYTIITLGMRVENRTATDIAAVTQSIIDHLRTRIRKLVVVLDGQNARLADDPTTCYGSHGQPADRNPLLLEYELVLKLRRRYDYTDIRVVSTIGASAPQSIAWCDASAAFVAFWGAGFAKYRWVCNMPGLALSGRWNLSHRHDLHIYDMPRWQEDPTPLVYIDPKCVTDRPDLGVYFSIVSPVPITYTNFEIDPAGLRAHLDRLVDSLSIS